ncbi:MAG: hypothetical protein IT435_19940 [Phycisphaerales bacterium]|nr:hypothetical protein [Phycisphaerales bacterium]
MSSLKDYLWGAFNARPLGMPIPPNWLGLAAFGLLGIVNPGFWVLGAGLELGYLLTCITSGRFRRVIDGRKMVEAGRQSQRKLESALSALSPEETERFLALDERCRLALGEQVAGGAGSGSGGGSGGGAGDTWRTLQADSLAKLRWAYLQLLGMRQAVVTVVENDGVGVSDSRSITRKLAELDRRLKDDELGADLRKSLQSQRDVLATRSGVQQEALSRLEQIEAELGRIEAQVELLREQALLAADPDAASARIDSVAESLAGTTRWIQEHQTIYEGIHGALDEAPPIEAHRG